MPSPIPGTLHTYTDQPTKLPLFESGDLSSSKCLVFFPGLFDGWSTVPYVAPLRDALKAAGWSLAQPHLTSSYKGFGTGTLEGDADQIEAAVDYLKSQGKETVVLLGHSTGCQQIMQYLTVKPRSQIARAIIQAPVSDRTHVEKYEPASSIQAVQDLYESSKARGTEKTDIATKKINEMFQVPAITPYRAWSLICVGGDDDFFSPDIPLHSSPSAALHRPLSQTFGLLPMSTPVLALFSGADECTPDVKTVQPQLLAAWMKAAPEGVLEGEIIPGASHNVKEEELSKILIERVLKFINA